VSGSHTLASDLEQAYRKTIYRVLADSPFDLRVDRYSPELEAWHRTCGVSSSALITAANPRSQQLSDRENQARNRSMRGDLQSWTVLPTSSVDPDGKWPMEPGLLIAGLGSELAQQLSSRWGQIAWLQSEHAASPALMWTGVSSVR